MVQLDVNGKPADLDVPDDMPLLWALRDVLNMTGTKFGCGAALCGACTIHIDKGGALKPTRVWRAVDCGIQVNPDTIRTRMESGIIFGLSAALHGEITIKDGRVEQTNFGDYRVLRINEAPGSMWRW